MFPSPRVSPLYLYLLRVLLLSIFPSPVSKTGNFWLQQMTELDIIVDNEYNGNFHPEKNLH